MNNSSYHGWLPSYDIYDLNMYPVSQASTDYPPQVALFWLGEQNIQLPGSEATGLPPTSHAELPGGRGYFINSAGQAIVLPSEGSDLVQSSQPTLHYLRNIRPSHQAHNQSTAHMSLQQMPSYGYYPTHGLYRSQPEYQDVSSLLQGQLNGQVKWCFTLNLIG
jgi:hypothetical protein